jgi:putative component of membrane protein insertase Oxa1/YidC/SpoIIIJ protein YidD
MQKALVELALEECGATLTFYSSYVSEFIFKVCVRFIIANSKYALEIIQGTSS